jgi:hypothetical protein
MCHARRKNDERRVVEIVRKKGKRAGEEGGEQGDGTGGYSHAG